MYAEDLETGPAGPARMLVRASVLDDCATARSTLCTISKNDPQWCNASCLTLQQKVCTDCSLFSGADPVRLSLCGTTTCPAVWPWRPSSSDCPTCPTCPPPDCPTCPPPTGAAAGDNSLLVLGLAGIAAIGFIGFAAARGGTS